MRTLSAALILLGACRSVPAPEPPRNVPVAPRAERAAPAPVELGVTFAPIDGWTQTRTADAAKLRHEGTRAEYGLVVHAARPRSRDPRAQWTEQWTGALARERLVTSLSPGPHRARLPSGYAVYWDGGAMKTAQGVDVVAVVYLVVGKDSVVPIEGVYRAGSRDDVLDDDLDYDLEELLGPWFSSIAIPGGPATEPLYDAGELIGSWTNVSGAGDTRSSEQVTLRAGGKYASTYRTSALGTAYTDKAAGTWSVEDGTLVMRDGDRRDVRTIWTVGRAPSGTAAIRLAPSYASNTNAPLANPRPADRAGWYVRSDQ